jgi:hypothetical protein
MDSVLAAREGGVMVKRLLIIAGIIAGGLGCGSERADLHVQIECGGEELTLQERRVVVLSLGRLMEKVTGARVVIDDSAAVVVKLTRKGEKIELVVGSNSGDSGGEPRYPVALQDRVRLRYAGMEAFLRHAYFEYLTKR